MARPRSSVADVSPHSSSRTSASAASAVSTQAAATSSQTALQHAQDAFAEVQKPTPPIEPPSSPPPAPRQTPPSSTSTHVRRNVDFVPLHPDVASARGAVHGMRSAACGLLDMWPLEGFVRLWRGRETEAEEDVPQPKTKEVDNNTEAKVDALQEVDLMGYMALPPYKPPKE